MEKINEGTKNIILNLLLLKDKVLMNMLPDEKYILMGINVIEKIVKQIDPINTNNEEIDKILKGIELEVVNNQFQMLDYSVRIGMEMAFNTIEKMKTKTYKK